MQCCQNRASETIKSRNISNRQVAVLAFGFRNNIPNLTIMSSLALETHPIRRFIAILQR
jgi:hypothetical protein